MTKIYKVAKILDDTTLIGNIGKNDNFKQNDKLKIVGSADVAIEDPDTGEILGYLGGQKGFVYIDEIYDKFSILKSKFVDKHIVKAPINTLTTTPANIGLQSMFKDREIPAHYEELNIDYDDVVDTISDEPIKVGDILEKV